MNIDTGCSESMSSALVNDESVKCDTCKRELKTRTEWIRTNRGFICENCYQNLLSPNMKINFNE